MSKTDWVSAEEFFGASAEKLVMMSMGVSEDFEVGDKVRHREDGLEGEVVEIGPMGSLVVDWDGTGLLDRCVRSEVDVVVTKGLV